MSEYKTITKQTNNFCLKEIKILEKSNPSKIFSIVFCDEAKEFVVVEHSKNESLHLHNDLDNLDFCPDYVKDILKELKD